MSDAPGSRRRAWPRLAPTALLLVGLGAWLSLPRERAAGAPGLPAAHVVLVDASASATRSRAGWSRFVRERLVAECDRAALAGAQLAVVRYAADVSVDQAPAAPADFRAWLEGRGREPYPPQPGSAGQGASELERALEVAEGFLADPARPAGELVVLSDGTFTGPDPRARLARLALSGSRVRRFEHVHLPPPDRIDLALEGLRAPLRIERGVPIAALVTVAMTTGLPAPGEATRASLSLELHGDEQVVARAQREVELPGFHAGFESGSGIGIEPGGAPPTWTERMLLPAPPPGTYNLRARVERAGAQAFDAIPENDGLAREIVVGEPIVCLLLAREDRVASLRATFRDAAFEGIAFRRTSFLDLAPDLARADVLVSESIGPAELPRAALGDFLRGGGGWLSLAGYGALRGWERGADGPPAAWLPLVPEPPDPDEREVVLFVDGSGSMTGPPFEKVKAAVFELVLGARSNDRFQLRFFTGAMEPVVFETTGARPEDLRRDLAPLFQAKVPRGPTDVLYALDQLAGQREASALPGLVLLVTDGRTLNWHPERSREVRRRLAASSTELAVIAIGEAVDREFLGSLLLPGEQLDEALDLDRLRSVFERRVHAERLDEDPGRRAHPVDPSSLGASGAAASSAIGAEVLRAQVDGVGLLEDGSFGSVARSLRAELRPGAELLWAVDDGAALLALQRVGAGLSAGLATTPVGDWAPFLVQRPQLLAPLLRALGRGRGAAPAGPRLSERDGELLLEHVPLDAAAEIEARFVRRSRSSRPADVLDALDPQRALGVRERELGRLVLTPPASGDGADPRSLRSAPRPAFLDRALPDGLRGRAAPEVAVDLVSGGRSLGRVFFTPRARAEFAPGGGGRVAWPETQDGVPPARDESVPRRGPHVAASWLLGLGLVLGALAAIRPRLRSGTGQGIG